MKYTTAYQPPFKATFKLHYCSNRNDFLWGLRLYEDCWVLSMPYKRCNDISNVLFGRKATTLQSKYIEQDLEENLWRKFQPIHDRGDQVYNLDFFRRTTALEAETGEKVTVAAAETGRNATIIGIRQVVGAPSPALSSASIKPESARSPLHQRLAPRDSEPGPGLGA